VPSRPYINWNVSDLDKLFAEARSDAGALQVLLVELSHRRTRAAKQLKEKVSERLAALGAPQPAQNSRAGVTESHYSAFLSYAREDRASVDVVRKIIDQSNLPTWLDTAGIAPGQQWESTLRRALVQSDCLVLIVTQNVRGSFVEKEIDLAIDMKKPIIPLIFDDFWDSGDTLCQRIRRYQAIDFRGTQNATGPTAVQLVQAVKALHLAPVLAMYSPKGGVGKTTLSAHLASYFFKRTDKDTLLIDLDPQANLSTLLVRPRPERQGITRGRMQLVEVLSKLRELGNSAHGLLDACARPDAFKNDLAGASKFIHTLDANEGRKWDIVVGDKRITEWAIGERDPEVWTRARRGFGRFVERARSLYDCVIIDMNPSVTDLTMLALGVATDIVSPVKPDIYSLQGLDLLEEISMEQLDEANGLGRVIIINEPKRDKEQLVRQQITGSAFADRLVKQDFADSAEFYASPATNLATDLSWLPAYGNWGPNPNPARKSLKAVGEEVARKTGIRMT
jgi:chromosome partitioning protein